MQHVKPHICNMAYPSGFPSQSGNASDESAAQAKMLLGCSNEGDFQAMMGDGCATRDVVGLNLFAKVDSMQDERRWLDTHKKNAFAEADHKPDATLISTRTLQPTALFHHAYAELKSSPFSTGDVGKSVALSGVILMCVCDSSLPVLLLSKFPLQDKCTDTHRRPWSTAPSASSATCLC